MSIDIIKNKKVYISTLSALLVIPISYYGYKRYNSYKKSQLRPSSQIGPITKSNFEFNKNFLNQIDKLESTPATQYDHDIINALYKQKKLNKSSKLSKLKRKLI